MNRIIAIFCLVLIALAGQPIIALAHGHGPIFESSLTVQINGSVVNAPADMNIIAGQVMVPLRWAAGQLGASSVQWDSASNSVTIKTEQDFYNLEKLASYAIGLNTYSEQESRQIWPLPNNAQNLDISSHVPSHKWMLELEHFTTERFALNQPLQYINMHIASRDGLYHHSIRVYSIENRHNHYYLPMDWLEYLFNAQVNYDKTTHILSIQTPAIDKIKAEVERIEESLIPAIPDEAVKLWGRGEQTRNGALQYAALSPQLRSVADKSSHVRQTYWVTGGSSPWVGPITIDKRYQISETRIEYTLSFPKITSVPPHDTAVEKLMVEKLLINGREGWYITQILRSSGYGILDGAKHSELHDRVCDKDTI
ncbi:MAG: stalk domain-containing protein [Syntrophomonas sp.]|nr:stalk domain-containing protein [Syntrophomonas sp.]